MKSGFPLLRDITQTLKVWQSGLFKLADYAEQNSVFSINETRTGDFWINGESIFRKVVPLGTLPNAANKTVPHGIERMKDLLRISGVAKSTAAQNFITLPYVQLTAIGDCLSMQVINDLIYLYTTTGNYSAYTGYAILEYTKS